MSILAPFVTRVRSRSLSSNTASRNPLCVSSANLAYAFHVVGLSGWTFLRRYVATRYVRTDQGGRFAFGDVPAGTYDVVVYDKRNGKLASQSDVVVKPDTEPAPLELTIVR